MLITLVLVVGVIYLFLHNGSATLIPALALPFSILGTFAVMQVLNFSLNNLSMMALILSIGFVVDDAIVMLENIVRHMENGDGPLEAALKGSKEIGFTILTMTTSLAAVFIPILFMSGILGPAVPRVRRHDHHGDSHLRRRVGHADADAVQPVPARRRTARRGFAGLMDRAFDALLRGYEWSLGIVLRHRVVMLACSSPCSSRPCRCSASSRRASSPIRTTIRCSSTCGRRRARRTTTWRKWAQQVADIVIKNPYVDSFMASVGGGGGGGGGGEQRPAAWCSCMPRADAAACRRSRSRSRCGRSCCASRASAAFVGLPPSLQIGGRQGNQNYSIMMQSLNTDELYQWAPRLEQAIAREVPEVQDVSTDLEMKSPRINLVIDRDKAAAVGLNATQIQNALYDALGPKWSSTIYGDTAQYRVLHRARSEIPGVRPIRCRRSRSRRRRARWCRSNRSVSFKETVGPQSINHSGQLPSVSVSFGLRPGVSLGAATDARQARSPTACCRRRSRRASRARPRSSRSR